MPRPTKVAAEAPPAPKYQSKDFARGELHFGQQADVMYKRTVIHMDLYLIPRDKAQDDVLIEMTDEDADGISDMTEQPLGVKGAVTHGDEFSTCKLPLPLAIRMANRIDQLHVKREQRMEATIHGLQTAEESALPGLLADLQYLELEHLALFHKEIKFPTRKAKIIRDAWDAYDNAAEEIAEEWEAVHGLNGYFPNRVSQKEKHDFMKTLKFVTVQAGASPSPEERSNLMRLCVPDAVNRGKGGKK